MVRVNTISRMDADDINVESSDGNGCVVMLVVLDVITNGGCVGGVNVILVASVASPRLLSPGKN